MKTTNILLGVIVLVLVAGGYVFLRKPVVEAPVSNSPLVDTSKSNNLNQEKNTAPEKFTGTDFDGNVVIGDGSIPITIAQAQVFRIAIKNFAYVNASNGKPVVGNIDVSAGEEIIWTNNDSMAHTVTFDNGMIDSGTIEPGKSFAYFFTKPGTYTYHCAFHPSMKGSLSFK